VRPGARVEPTHHPEDDFLRNLPGDDVDRKQQARERGQERAHSHAGQQQRRNWRRAAAGRNSVDEQQRQERGRDGRQGQRDDGRRGPSGNKDRDCTEDRSRSYAHETRLAEWISEQALHQRARRREARTDKRGDEHARKPDEPDDGLVGAGHRDTDCPTRREDLHGKYVNHNGPIKPGASDYHAGNGRSDEKGRHYEIEDGRRKTPLNRPLSSVACDVECRCRDSGQDRTPP
jgi:hypothetical protein